MEGTVTSEADVERLGAELDRLRAVLAASRRETGSPRWPSPFEQPEPSLATLDPDAYLGALTAPEANDDDGRRLTALLVAKLRFERVQRGSDLAMRWFDADPQAFADVFRRYHATEPSTDVFPAPEADRFFAFCEREGLLRRG
jgi:hypothetical protein